MTYRKHYGIEIEEFERAMTAAQCEIGRQLVPAVRAFSDHMAKAGREMSWGYTCDLEPKPEQLPWWRRAWRWIVRLVRR